MIMHLIKSKIFFLINSFCFIWDNYLRALCFEWRCCLLCFVLKNYPRLHSSQLMIDKKLVTYSTKFVCLCWDGIFLFTRYANQANITWKWQKKLRILTNWRRLLKVLVVKKILITLQFYLHKIYTTPLVSQRKLIQISVKQKRN